LTTHDESGKKIELSDSEAIKIGVVQPTYLPWLPFFERMAASDIFIYLDDVKYSKNSFHNRNAVKGPNGRLLLTVPVHYKGNSDALINEILTDDRTKWQDKHIKTVQQCYSKSPFYKHYNDEIISLYEQKGKRLIDFILPIIEFLKRELGIKTPCYLSSGINVPGNRNEKLVNLCKHFNGTHFIVKPGTEEYHPSEEFLPFGIKFYHLRYSSFQYPQLYGAFETMLSAIDYLFNRGPRNFITDLEDSKKEQPVYARD
jgi:hypothetical protein